MTDYRELPPEDKMEMDIDLELLSPEVANDIKSGSRCTYCLNEDCCCTCEH